MPVLEFICGWMILLVIFLMGQKTVWGPISGVATQTCWAVYTILTRQYGLLVPMIALGLMYIWVIFRWSRKKTKNDPKYPLLACANCKSAVATTLFQGYYRCSACVRFLRRHPWTSFNPKDK